MRKSTTATSRSATTWSPGRKDTSVDLAAPDEYKNHDWGKWSLDTLPIDPTPDWQWKVSRDKGADRQYKVVAGLMRRGDVGHACRRMRPRP